MIVNTNPERKLLWFQDFSNHSLNSIDENIWNYDLGDGSHVGLIGWGNNEREFYTKDSISVQSSLIIQATHQGDESPIQTYYGPAEWTSGKIHTANKVGFKFGYLEVRAKMPHGKGTWPAIWLLGDSLNHGVAWPMCGEIDIFEGTGNHPFQIQGTLHGPEYFGADGATMIFQHSNELSEDFHTYAISWSENRMEWFFDGEIYNTISSEDEVMRDREWPFNAEFYLILNLAIGGWFAGDVDPELRSAHFEIDWIKYFSENGVGELFLH